MTKKQSEDLLKKPEDYIPKELGEVDQDRVKGGNFANCVICKSEIKKGAKKCIKCNSFQNPLRRFFSGLDLQALVALVPVVALAFVFVKGHIVVHKSDLRVAILDCTKNKIRVVASNLGDRAAVLNERAVLLFLVNDNLDPRPRLLMKDPSPDISPLIKPGESVLIDFFPVTIDGKKARLDPCPESARCEYKVTFDVIAFDHKPYKIVVSCTTEG
ncbi:MAG: hypothetical protein ACMUIU_10040 [bacterium]